MPDTPDTPLTPFEQDAPIYAAAVRTGRHAIPIQRLRIDPDVLDHRFYYMAIDKKRIRKLLLDGVSVPGAELLPIYDFFVAVEGEKDA